MKDFESLKKLQDEVITYETSLGLGYDFHSKVPGENTTAFATASYVLRGVEPVSNLGEGHHWHELRAEFNLSQKFVQPGTDSPGTNDWAGLTAYVSWINGEAPPTYVDANIIMTGLSVRF